MGPELLSVAEMGRADRLSIEAGTPGITLMENAGAGIARAIVQRWAKRPVRVLCGPGNNGGDGFVVARLLKERGWPVRLSLLGAREKLAGDAALAAARWDGAVEPLLPDLPGRGAGDGGLPLVVDALFGAGLGRPIDGAAAAALDAVTASGAPVVAVDVPSGVHGDTGAVWGTAAPAALTVTFFRKKPGHLLLPGRVLCGETMVVDIGIAGWVLDEIAPTAIENGPAGWCDRFPWPRLDGHKYARGHAVVRGGARMTGAARLAALAARRAGAGLVTIMAPEPVLPIYAAGPPGTLISPLAEWQEQLDDQRRNAVLIGPGAGTGEETRQAVLDALGAGKALVLDADGLTSFAGTLDTLVAALHRRCVLTPHEGEFARLFGDRLGVGRGGPDDKPARARAAAAATGAVVLLKGADTVIAAPDGRLAINANAPAELATAGSGDVLAGLILGLLAQGMAPFDAACAGAWLHGAAAASFGPGLIAEDVIDRIPQALARLGIRPRRE